jgi:hypothetical protein
MTGARWAWVVALGLSTLTQTPARAVDEKKVNRAIDHGVEGLRRMQRGDGTWPHVNIGATALAGLTLLECGVKSDDRAIKDAAAAVRKGSVDLTHTYSLALGILFLDRLDDPADTPLIEAMVIRLLAGQNASGGWGYFCPDVDAEEVRRLTAAIRDGSTLKGRAALPKLPAKGKRTLKDLSREGQKQLAVLSRLGVQMRGFGDNSNTQFATLGLWVGRRYGVPVNAALLRVDARYRATQNPDGGWGYTEFGGRAAFARRGRKRGHEASTSTMTCAGLLGLAVGHGALAAAALSRNPKAGKRDVRKDANLIAGLQALSTAVGVPIGDKWKGRGPAPVPGAGGRAYYFLWSLERVAVALDLKTLGKKDWYAWGAEVLLANQQGDGTWQGEYGGSGADTCFALLFLKRVNLMRDLTGSIKGLNDPGGKVLKSGGVGGGGLKGSGGERLAPSGIGGKPAKKPARETGPSKPGPKPKPDKARTPEESASRLGHALVRANADIQGPLLKKLREGKGSAYTEALAEAIPDLAGSIKRKARNALAERLTRMKATTLRAYLKDEDPEIRRAAALACAVKDSRANIPDLIERLKDRNPVVERAAYAALKVMSGKDFGPPARATGLARDNAILAWRRWWAKASRD